MTDNEFRRCRKANRKLHFEDSQVSDLESKGQKSSALDVRNCNSFNSQLHERESAITPDQEEMGSPVLLGKGARSMSKTLSPVLMSQKTRKRSPVIETNRKKAKFDYESNFSESVINSEPQSPVLLVAKKTRNKNAEIQNVQDTKKMSIVSQTTNSAARIVAQNRSPKSNIVRTVGFTDKRPPRTSRPAFFFFEGKDTFSCLNIENEQQSGGQEGDYSIQICSQESLNEIGQAEPSRENNICDLSSESDAAPSLKMNDIPQVEAMDASQLPGYRTPTHICEDTDNIVPDGLDSGGKKKTRQKRGSLLRRLENIKRRDASEKRIHEHKRKIMKDEKVEERNLHIVHSWKNGERTIFKCQQIEMAQRSFEVAYIYVVADWKLGSEYCKVGQGTFIKISSPWQEITLHALNAILYLSVNTMEVVDKVRILTMPVVDTVEVPIQPYKENENELFKALFDLESNVFFF